MASNLTHFDPFSDLTRFDPFRGIDALFRNMSLKPFGDTDVEPRIKLDVSENDEAYMVKADIPGVKKEDIKVSIEGSQVSISAEMKKDTEEKKGETVVRSERYYGQQYRSFSLAQDIDDTKAVARYQDGVLELLLPKKTGNSSRKQIQIQ